jgi:hypothetical protein
MLPVDVPLHDTSVLEEVTERTTGWESVSETEELVPTESVTVNV